MQNPLNRKDLELQSFTVKMALHLRWLTTEKFQNYETVKGGCIPSKNSSKNKNTIR